MAGKNINVTVYSSGVDPRDDTITVREGDTVTWSRHSRVHHFHVHFDESPFDTNFGKQDHQVGDGFADRLFDTGALMAHAKHPTQPNRHKYTLTVFTHAGERLEYDPHVIVVATG